MHVDTYGQIPNRHPGKLFIVEGIDGSGKSTQLTLLAQWLRSQGHLVVFSEWNSSPIVRARVVLPHWRGPCTSTTGESASASDNRVRKKRG